MKRQIVKFPWDLYWENKTYKLKRSILYFAHASEVRKANIIHSKIAPFWLVKATRIIHHNQLLLTQFGKNFVILNRWRQSDVKSAAWLQVTEPLTEKTCGGNSFDLEVRKKWLNSRRNILLVSRRNIVYKRGKKSIRRTTSASCRKFADLNRRLSPKLPDHGHKHKTVKFDMVEEWSATKYIQFSWTD